MIKLTEDEIKFMSRCVNKDRVSKQEIGIILKKLPLAERKELIERLINAGLLEKFLAKNPDNKTSKKLTTYFRISEKGYGWLEDYASKFGAI